jgi:hypothetical protein
VSNTLLTVDLITKEALRRLHNTIKFSKTINRQYDSQFAKTGAKIGSALRIRRPVQFVVNDGKTFVQQDALETYTTLNVTTQKHVGLKFSSADMALKIEEFSDRYIKGPVERLASKIDADCAAYYYKVANYVGTPGTIPATAQVWLDAGAKLDNFCAPRDGSRFAGLSPLASARTVNGLSALFNDQTKLGAQYRKGMMSSDTLGADFFMSQNIPLHTNGLQAGGGLINGANQVTSGWAATQSLITDDWTASTTLTKGTVFTLPAVYSVNPETKQSTGELQAFTVMADITATGTDATLTISPAIIISGPYQNVDSAPADGDAITLVGSASTGYKQSLLYHSDFLTLAMADLEMPRGVDMASRQNMDGISMRLIRDFDTVNDDFICRLDVLYGIEALRPEWACRVYGSAAG